MLLQIASFHSISWLRIYTYHILLIHSSVDGRLGYFHVLALIISVAMNIGLQVYFQNVIVSGHVPRSGIAGSYRSSIFRHSHGNESD